MVLERLPGDGRVLGLQHRAVDLATSTRTARSAQVLTSAGITLQHEIEMLTLARELDMVTIGLAFDEEDSLRLVEEAQPDIFCFHAGTTKGGLTGYDSGETIEETAARTEEANQKLRALKPDMILVAHGAAMETPEDAQYMLDHTIVRRLLDRLVDRAAADRARRVGRPRASSRPCASRTASVGDAA